MSEKETPEQFVEFIRKAMVPPGSGVHTVHTARERKLAFQKHLYGTDQEEEINERWLAEVQDTLAKEESPKLLLGLCSDTGGGILRGANWGPLFIRDQLKGALQKRELVDLGDVRVIPHLLHDDLMNEKAKGPCRSYLYGQKQSEAPVAPLSLGEEVLNRLYTLRPGARVILLGGDHSVSYPAVKSYLQNAKARGKKAALIHFDAHTDLLNERMGVPICFGSWTYHILPFMSDPSLVFQIGIRSTGKSKEHWESTFGVRQFWAKEVLEQGASTIAKNIHAQLKEKAVDEIYISFDIDAFDAEYVQATGTPEKGGLRPHDAAQIIQILSKDFPLGGADLVEVAPFLHKTVSGIKALAPEPDSTLLCARAVMNQYMDFMSP